MGLVSNRTTGLLTPAGILSSDGEIRPIEPGERFGPMTAVTPGNEGGCPEFLEWARCTLSRRVESLRWFLHGAIWQKTERPYRRLLLRGGQDRGDLGNLFPVLGATLGDYVTRMDYETWSRWPKGRTLELGAELRGCRVVFLTGMERWLRFSHQAVTELLRTERVNFWSDERCWQPQDFPRYFILPGGLGRKSERFDEYLDRATFCVPGPDPEPNGPIDLEPILAAEAPHILAWMLSDPEGKQGD